MYLFSLAGERYTISGEDESTVIYIFSKSLQDRISQASWSASLIQWYDTSKVYLFSTLQCFFGLCLIISLALIVVIGIIIICAASNSSSNSRSGNGFSRAAARNVNWQDIYLCSWFWNENPFFFGYYYRPNWRRNYDRDVEAYRLQHQIAQRPNYRYNNYDDGRSDVNIPTAVPLEENAEEDSTTQLLVESSSEEEFLVTVEPVAEIKFLQAIFSFVFGDGHPGPSEVYLTRFLQF